MKKIIAWSCFIGLIWPGLLWGEKVDLIAIIVNPANTIEELSKGELARIYKGRLEKWPDGQRIFTIDSPVGSKIRRRFHSVVLKSNPLKKFFKPGSPLPFRPMISKSAFGTNKLVSRIPNAIGYLYLDQVREGQKILKIDGALPGEDGYKIK